MDKNKNLSTFDQQVAAHGLTPPVEPNEHNVLGPRWFQHELTLPDGASTEIDLKDGDFLATDRMVDARFGSPGNLDFIAHILGVQLVGFSSEWTDLPASEKAKVVEGITMECTQKSIPYAEALGMHIQEAYADQYVDVDSDNTALEIYGSCNGGPLLLDEPWTLNLATDRWKISFNDVDQPAGGIRLFFRWFGFFAPNDVPRAKLIELGNGMTIPCGARGIPNASRAVFNGRTTDMVKLRMPRGIK